jgi:hypothetical protein
MPPQSTSTSVPSRILLLQLAFNPPEEEHKEVFNSQSEVQVNKPVAKEVKSEHFCKVGKNCSLSQSSPGSRIPLLHFAVVLDAGNVHLEVSNSQPEHLNPEPSILKSVQLLFPTPPSHSSPY